MKKILTSVALVMFTLAVPDIVQAATLGTATANPSLNLRQSATTSATVLSSIPKNSQVNVLSKNGSNWYNVVYNGKTGWVSGQYLMVKETVAPVVAPTSAPNVTKTAGTVTANPSLNLRQSATTSAAVLSSIPKNSQVNILSKNGSNWYNVVYNGKTGWVSGQYLMVKETVAPVVAPTPAPNVTKTAGTVTANPSLNLRRSATTSAAVLAAIPKNTQVAIISKNASNWYNVTYNGTTGWVYGAYLSVSQTQPSRSDSSELVKNALSLQGVPYVWGGTSRSGFDCSGFAQYVFKESGIDLPRTTSEQFIVGTSVDRSRLQLGDLVFFSTYEPGPSHVGIYIGGGRFVGAANSGVIISDINSSYYSSRYVGARRVR